MDNDARAQRLKSNIDRLCTAISSLPLPRPESLERCRAFAQNLPLSHATSSGNMVAICTSDCLKSMKTLIAEGKLANRDCAETKLGTENGVFFYVGAISYPATNFGFLFKSTIEIAHQLEGGSTPFDSGGLIKHFNWGTKNTESPVEFFNRHELPIPDHRRYLHLSFERLYNGEPLNYLDPEDLNFANDPIGLADGDFRRRKIHEVRIPGSVPLRGPNLLAVFAPKNRVAAIPEVRGLFRWCRENAVDRRSFDSPSGDDFSGLRSASLDYLREKLY